MQLPVAPPSARQRLGINQFHSNSRSGRLPRPGLSDLADHWSIWQAWIRGHVPAGNCGSVSVRGSEGSYALREKTENAARDSISPRVAFTLHIEGTATDAPIPVASIRPTDPPHHVKGRYESRNSHGLTALSPTQLDEIAAAKRKALTEDAVGKGPIGQALVALLDTVQGLHGALAPAWEAAWVNVNCSRSEE